MNDTRSTPTASAGPQPPLPLLEIDVTGRTVTLNGQPVALKARAFDLLATMAREPGRVFSADALKAAVWPMRRVEDSNLRMQVQAMRELLGKDAVDNVPGRGYCLRLPARLRHHLPPGSNLPHWLDSLLGRDQDIAALDALLAEHRLVTVLGAGGIGKTRLAQHLALAQRDRHRDGAWWVDLAPLGAGSDAARAVAQAMARALNLQTASLKGQEAADQLGRALANWQGLVLLDNAEHLCGLAGPLPPLVLGLLQAAPGLRLIVTSQQALKLPEEWVYRLDTLPVPPPQASPAAARASPAVQLLERRARAANHRFELADAELHLATAVVRQLDGIALAIEMAASRLEMLGLPALFNQLGQRLQLLGSPDDASLPRHRTLRAALDWSYSLLSTAEQAALRQLSVLAAPFRLDTALQVVAVPGLTDGGHLQLVQALVDKSLLQVQPAAGPGCPVRLRLLDSTRLHAAEALQASRSDEEQATLRRHVQAMVQLARAAKQDFEVASDLAWSAAWVPDHVDLMLGFDRAHQLGLADDAAQIIELLVLGANITGWVEPALARAAASRALAPQASAIGRARLIGWGNGLQDSAQSRAQAVALRVQAWRDVPGPDGAVGLCTALAMQALVSEEAGDRAAADQALAECELLEDPQWSARLRRRCSWLALSRMAVLRDDAAVRQRAHRLSHQLMAELGQLGALREMALVQSHMAQFLRIQGRLPEAIALWRSLADSQTASGCDIDAGISLALIAAALVEAALVGTAPVGTALADTALVDAALVRAELVNRADGSAADPAAALLAQARDAALQALPRLAPLPALMRHVLVPLALLACRQGDPEHAALLLAGFERLRHDLQLGSDRVSTRLITRLQLWLDASLDPESRALAARRGDRLDAAGLRQLALAWLQRQAARPAASPGRTPSLA